MKRATIGVVVMLCLTASATAAPLTQKIGKEAAKGITKGVQQQHIDFSQSAREAATGLVDALYSRRQKIDEMAYGVGRQLARGAVSSAADACDGDRHCIRTQAHEVAYALGRGVAQGIAAKLSIVPSILGFVIGFIVAAVLGGLIALFARHRRREPLPNQP